jgi:hypothetical protein
MTQNTANDKGNSAASTFLYYAESGRVMGKIWIQQNIFLGPNEYLLMLNKRIIVGKWLKN